ncbi:MAG: pyruvate kinase, partial [Dehalococcoidia bacterium]
MKLDLRRKTKIVCTLGPATESPRMIERLIRSGMNVARINLSHGDEESHRALIRHIRAAGSKLGAPVAVLVDVPGPRYRTGDLKDGHATLRKGARLVLTSRAVPGDEHEVSLNLPDLVRDVAVGDSILLDDGAIRLIVRQTTDTDVVCRVATGGVLRPRRGIAVPGVKMSAPFLTEGTRQHLLFAAEQRAEYVALSFVSRPGDVAQARAVMAEAGATTVIVAKIERTEAVRNFDR